MIYSITNTIDAINRQNVIGRMDELPIDIKGNGDSIRT